LLFQKANALWSKLPIRYAGATLIAIPALCLTLITVASIVSQQLNHGLYNNIDRTKTKIIEVKNLLIHLLNAETGSRGFNLTRDPQYLEPYNLANTQIPAILTELKQTFDSDLERQKIQEIERLSNIRLQIIIDRVNKIKNLNNKRSSLQSDEKFIYEGKQVMDELRLLVNDLEAEQLQSLAKYEKRLASIQDITNIILWSTAAISLLIYLKVIYLFSKIDWHLTGQEVELAQSNSLLQEVIDNVVDGVITLNEANEIESCNNAASAMFGSPTEEIIGQKIQTLIFPENQAQHQSLEGLFDNFSSPFLAKGHRKIGSDFPIEISVSKLPSGNQKMLIFRDITERQQAQQKLESHIKELSRLSLMLSKANQALAERNQELDQFAYVASHDLKAPLRAISSLSEWIEEDLGDKLAAETQYQMQLLRQRVRRMEALINGLLEYCRVGRSQTKTETVDVEVLLQEIVDSIGVPPTFKVEIQPDIPIVTAKTLLLRQVFANLISNAIKHQGSSEGNVIISFKELDRFYEFAVTDTGPGIAPEYQEQIFKIFQTLEARDTQENTGIGLAIVKKIVESEGGKIEVSSDLGIGSTFSFTWSKEPRD
jgi:PAS domain S-box-containing protein